MKLYERTFLLKLESEILTMNCIICDIIQKNAPE